MRQRQTGSGQSEGRGIALDEYEGTLAERGRLENAARQRVEELEGSVRDCDRGSRSCVSRSRQSAHELEQVRAELESRRGRAETLEALQAAEFGADDEAVRRWLQRAGLDREPRLAQRLAVDKRWERAVETVLGDFLQAVCVKRPDEHLRSLPGNGDLMLIDADDADDPDAAGSLAEKVEHAGSARALLAGVLTAESLDAAIQLRSRLRAGQSVITADGIWLGPAGYVSVVAPRKPAA